VGGHILANEHTALTLDGVRALFHLIEWQHRYLQHLKDRPELPIFLFRKNPESHVWRGVPGDSFGTDGNKGLLSFWPSPRAHQHRLTPAHPQQLIR